MSRRLLAPIIGLVTFLALWEGFVRVFHVRKFILRPPSTALRHLWNFRGDYLAGAWVTIQHSVIGLTIALVAASFLPLFFGLGWIYFAGAFIGGALFLQKSWQLTRAPGRKAALGSFHASLIQLTLVLLGAIIDAQF